MNIHICKYMCIHIYTDFVTNSYCQLHAPTNSFTKGVNMLVDIIKNQVLFTFITDLNNVMSTFCTHDPWRPRTSIFWRKFLKVSSVVTLCSKFGSAAMVEMLKSKNFFATRVSRVRKLRSNVSDESVICQ